MIRVKHPEQVPAASNAILSALRLDAAERIPESIRGSMLAIPCKRMLRAVYGSAWAAIWAWGKDEISNWLLIWWFGVRRRIGWLSEEEVEALDQ